MSIAFDPAISNAIAHLNFNHIFSFLFLFCNICINFIEWDIKLIFCLQDNW